MSVRLRIFFIICFVFLGLASRSFADVCQYYNFGVSYYNTSAARSAAVASFSGASYLSVTSSLGSWTYLCYGIPVGLNGQGKYTSTVISGITVAVGSLAVLDTSCDDGSDGDGECECRDATQDLSEQCGESGYTMVDEDACEGRCNDCVAEAEQQCGDKEIEWTEDGDCSYRCLQPCQDMHDRLAYQCGGSDQYWLAAAKKTNPDGSSSEECAGACGTPPDANQDTDGDGTPDKQDDDIDGDGVPNDQDDDMDGDGIPNAQDTAPTVPGGVDTSKAPKYGGGNDVGTGGSDPGTADPDKPPPDPKKPDPSGDCYEKWHLKIEACGGMTTKPGTYPVYDSSVLATWDNQTCTGTCKDDDNCTKEQLDAADAACKYGYSMSSDCTYTCKDCDNLQWACIADCKPAQPKTNFCEEQNGAAVDALCECENASACEQYKASCTAACSQDGCGGIEDYWCQQNSAGQISSKICECFSCTPHIPDPKNPEPDDPGDTAGWLEGIKRDTDTISDNTYAVKQSIDGLKDALSDVSIKGSGIDTTVGDSSLGDSGNITGAGYGTAPADGDVPGETSFGTYAPTGTDHRGQVSSALNGVELTAAGSVCEFSLTVPVPRLSGLSLAINWQNFSVNLCPFESILATVGSFLVYFTALRELFKFAA